VTISEWPSPKIYKGTPELVIRLRDICVAVHTIILIEFSTMSKAKGVLIIINHHYKANVWAFLWASSLLLLPSPSASATVFSIRGCSGIVITSTETERSCATAQVPNWLIGGKWWKTRVADQLFFINVRNLLEQAPQREISERESRRLGP